MTLIQMPEPQDQTALDVIEELVIANNWICDRLSESEIAVQIPGRWGDHNFYCSLCDVLDAMLCTVALDVRVPADRLTEINLLLGLINERIWLGHFCAWREENLLAFRHALPLRGTLGPSVEQIEDVISSAVEECDRFYPAIQYVIWGGKTAQDALTAAMIDTVGEA
jgi:hypothetical protein